MCLSFPYKVFMPLALEDFDILEQESMLIFL